MGENTKKMMDNAKDTEKFSIIHIILILIFVLLGVSIIFLVCKDKIYAFADNSSNVINNIDIAESSENLTATDDIELNNINSVSDESEADIVVAVLPVLKTETTDADGTDTPQLSDAKIEETAESFEAEAESETADTIESEGTAITEDETESPTEEYMAAYSTEPPVQPTTITELPVYTEPIWKQVDYPTDLFAHALEIQTEDKSIVIEPPPLGRDLELQAKITPINTNIPNPTEYFKDIIFLGDSVTTGFDLYRDYIEFNGEKVMTQTTVIAVKSYGIYNATRKLSDKSIHPLMNGVQTLPEDIIAEKEASKVFICLGLNDVSWNSYESYFQNYAALINRIREKSPKKTVVIMSITPLTYEGQKETLTNEMIMEFNKLLIEFAAYNNIPFIDYAAALRDENNHLYDALSSDNYCHIVREAYDRLTEYMLYHSIE